MTANKIAAATQGAYSRDRYTAVGWLRIVRLLLKNGATPAETIWILNSKHMRWAADYANRREGTTVADFDAYATSMTGGRSYTRIIHEAHIALAVARAKAGEQGLSGADLAGTCEGEDVADLIDFARQIRDDASQLPTADAALTIDILVKRAAAILARIEGRAK